MHAQVHRPWKRRGKYKNKSLHARHCYVTYVNNKRTQLLIIFSRKSPSSSLCTGRLQWLWQNCFVSVAFTRPFLRPLRSRLPHVFSCSMKEHVRSTASVDNNNDKSRRSTLFSTASQPASTPLWIDVAACLGLSKKLIIPRTKPIILFPSTILDINNNNNKNHRYYCVQCRLSRMLRTSILDCLQNFGVIRSL